MMLLKYQIGDQVRCPSLGLAGIIYGWDVTGSEPVYYVNTGLNQFWSKESGLELIGREAPARVARTGDAPRAEPAGVQ